MNTRDTFRAVDAVVMAVGSCFLVWTLMPPSLKLELALMARSEWGKVITYRQRRNAIKQMEFEMLYWLPKVLSDYDREGDATKLAADLAS